MAKTKTGQGTQNYSVPAQSQASGRPEKTPCGIQFDSNEEFSSHLYRKSCCNHVLLKDYRRRA